jgi:type IV pilus assembly protein PilY1
MARIIKILIAFSALLILIISTPCYGLDTDLYVLSGVDIPPNVLVILDSSASMDEVVSGSDADYTQDIDYGALLTPPAVVYPQYAVYYKTSGNKWNLWINDYRTDPALNTCPDLKTSLETYGHAENNNCAGGRRDYQTGNYRNFLQISGPGGSRSRFGLANGVIHSYVDTVDGVRFGLMAFNRDSGTPPNTVKYDPVNKLEYVFGEPRDNALDADGGQMMGFVDEVKNGKTSFFNMLASLKNDSWSPLAETLYDAGTYIQMGKDGYTSPVQYPCQKIYILIISDGKPTKDNRPALSSIGDLTGDGKAGQLDDVAKHLFNIDLTGGSFHTPQNIKTYTIGFSVDDQLLKDTARVGGGKYFYVYSSQSFNIAFQTFIADVLAESTSYVAPVVPISQMETFRSGNRMFLAMFKPTWTSFWKGNIKKFGIAELNGSGIFTGDVLDKSGKLAIDSNTNSIDDKAVSYWSETADGGEVEAGGVGEVLLKRTTSRKIYTYFGTNTNLTDSSNTFGKSNASITPLTLSLAFDDITGREKIIDFMHGLDSYDENRNGILNEKRVWILGAFIHSRPLVIHYSDRSIIYAGANDGMLHAFDNGEPLNVEKTLWSDGTGEEFWAFIPPKLLPNLKNLNGEALEFFVDGAPKAYIEKDSSGNLTKAILIFGLRRGGNHYIALDVTDYNNPKWLWEISPTTPGYGELGQTWSSPLLGKIQYGAETKPVAFIGGGYDENQDLATPGNDIKGRAVYIIDILNNGNLLWSYSKAKNPMMKYSIPSDIARVDTNGDGIIDRLYVGDVGGQMWRFDIGDPDTSKWSGKILFDSNPGLSLKRKIFYPPDVTLEKGNYEILFFGTGDREHPKDTGKENRLYAIKDKNPSATLTENDLVDVTLDKLQNPDILQSEKTDILNALSTQNGWFIKLNQNLGEKCLSNSVIFYGVVYYSTFQPTFGEPGDRCFLGEGIARIYALNYKTGNAVFNLDGIGTLSELTRADRSAEIGASIPSGVIVTFVGGTTVAYAGVGGGVYRPPLPVTKVLFPINWRTVF